MLKVKVLRGQVGVSGRVGEGQESAFINVLSAMGASNGGVFTSLTLMVMVSASRAGKEKSCQTLELSRIAARVPGPLWASR